MTDVAVDDRVVRKELGDARAIDAPEGGPNDFRLVHRRRRTHHVGAACRPRARPRARGRRRRSRDAPLAGPSMAGCRLGGSSFVVVERAVVGIVRD